VAEPSDGQAVGGAGARHAEGTFCARRSRWARTIAQCVPFKRSISGTIASEVSPSGGEQLVLLCTTRLQRAGRLTRDDRPTGAVPTLNQRADRRIRRRSSGLLVHDTSFKTLSVVPLGWLGRSRMAALPRCGTAPTPTQSTGRNSAATSNTTARTATWRAPDREPRPKAHTRNPRRNNSPCVPLSTGAAAARSSSRPSSGLE